MHDQPHLTHSHQQVASQWQPQILLLHVPAFSWHLQVHDYSGANMFKMNAGVKEASKQIIKLFQVRQDDAELVGRPVHEHHGCKAWGTPMIHVCLMAPGFLKHETP